MNDYEKWYNAGRMFGKSTTVFNSLLYKGSMMHSWEYETGLDKEMATIAKEIQKQRQNTRKKEKAQQLRIEPYKITLPPLDKVIAHAEEILHEEDSGWPLSTVELRKRAEKKDSEKRLSLYIDQKIKKDTEELLASGWVRGGTPCDESMIVAYENHCTYDNLMCRCSNPIDWEVCYYKEVSTEDPMRCMYLRADNVCDCVVAQLSYWNEKEE